MGTAKAKSFGLFPHPCARRDPPDRLHTNARSPQAGTSPPGPANVHSLGPGSSPTGSRRRTERGPKFPSRDGPQAVRVLELREVHLVSDFLEPLKWRREHFVVTSDGISGASIIDSLAEHLDVSWFAPERKPLIRTRQEC